jgi:hypothetical protein
LNLAASRLTRLVKDARTPMGFARVLIAREPILNVRDIFAA